MSQNEIDILKKKDDEFVKKAGIIKSITAVHGNTSAIMLNQILLNDSKNLIINFNFQ